MLPSNPTSWFQIFQNLFSTPKEPAPDAPHLYALLVGINEYPYPVRRLKGCVRDIKKMGKYLQNEERQGAFHVHIKTLTNEEATKAAIAEQFTAHLGQAGPQDVALFFFAGHGAQEYANKELWSKEPDGKLEGLVCYDSITRDEKGTLLADKELRYLIHQIAVQDSAGAPKPPHIIAIFDCCHSGGNTRNIGIGEENEEYQERRFIPMKPTEVGQQRMSSILDERDWSDFIFADQDGVTEAALKSLPLGEVLPQGNHIQLAACRSDESSYEVGRGGIFTQYLIEVLSRSQGSVSYYDLRGRLKNYIKNQFRQTPQLYEVGGQQLIYHSFLNKEKKGKPLSGLISYNQTDGWTMDMGSIHGVSKQAEKIRLTNPRTGEQVDAKIGTIEASRTHLLLSNQALGQLDTRESYLGSIEGYLSAPIQVYIHNLDQDEEAAMRLKDLLDNNGKNLFYTDDEKGADYTVQLAFGHYYITYPEDLYRPLVMPTEDYSDDAAKSIVNFLVHISQWEYVKRLENNGNNELPRNALKVEVFKVTKDKQGREQLILLDIEKEEEIVAELDEIAPREYESVLRIKLTNMSSYKLWVSFLYLYKSFEVDPEWLTGLVQMLEPRKSHEEEGGSIWILEDSPDIYFGLEQSTRLFDWKEDVSFFKVIASRTEFDVRPLTQGPLPDPAELSQRERGEAQERAGRKNKKEENAEADAWMTRLFTIRLPNPEYHKISMSRLEALLKTEAAEFIYHLYLESEEPFGGEVKLKEGIEWLDEADRGLFFKIKLSAANWVSRQIRHFKYRKMIKEFPDRIRIVSEGDSWFQHPDPRVLDIIDQLFTDHAIYSLGAGGDTLENYFKKAEYKKAIDKEKPRFFLMSGGGNDILGKNIEAFLLENIVAWDDPKIVLSDAFFEKVEKLGGLYRQVFEEIKESFPGLKILCHGYDYIDPDPEEGWFGRYAGKKIEKKDDLKRLADFLINHFNETLAAVAKDFDHVHYLDLRGMVSHDKKLWFDEIHPNSTGFKDVAEKFRLKIREEE